jgi:hypothetical protein
MLTNIKFNMVAGFFFLTLPIAIPDEVRASLIFFSLYYLQK